MLHQFAFSFPFWPFATSGPKVLFSSPSLTHHSFKLPNHVLPFLLFLIDLTIFLDEWTTSCLFTTFLDPRFRTCLRRDWTTNPYTLFTHSFTRILSLDSSSVAPLLLHGRDSHRCQWLRFVRETFNDPSFIFFFLHHLTLLMTATHSRFYRSCTESIYPIHPYIHPLFSIH